MQSTKTSRPVRGNTPLTRQHRSTLVIVTLPPRPLAEILAKAFETIAFVLPLDLAVDKSDAPA